MSFCIRSGRIFDHATIASCDHFSGFGMGAVEVSSSLTAFISPPETECQKPTGGYNKYQWAIDFNPRHTAYDW
ncbi:MAG: hypothetical protein V7K26_15535 [Nostoc sp.]|uniref:hypothetical protein n=1 Tax=Nostoc sp. TaxID=1180 RepID=UPI002FF0B858